MLFFNNILDSFSIFNSLWGTDLLFRSVGGHKKKKSGSHIASVQCPAIVRHFLLLYRHQDKTLKWPCSLSHFQLFSSFMPNYCCTFAESVKKKNPALRCMPSQLDLYKRAKNMVLYSILNYCKSVKKEHFTRQTQNYGKEILHSEYPKRFCTHKNGASSSWWTDWPSRLCWDTHLCV